MCVINIALDRNAIDCDYFAFRDGNPQARDAFFGEYMKQYSWAESTLGALL